MNAQVSFLEGELSLIHIPLELYSSFLQPILRVLLPQLPSLQQDPCEWEERHLGLTEDHKHGFLNVSVTPIECSIVCHTSWVATVFEPVIRGLSPEAAREVSVSRDSYVALCVISAGMDAGSRVVDLSSPLALAGIPIFFITTYYSDFILVPAKDRQSVVRALLARDFQVTENESSFVVPSSPATHRHHPHQSHSRGGSAASSGISAELHQQKQQQQRQEQQLKSGLPLPSNAAELQARTFDLLRQRRVEAHVDPDLHLIHCSGRDEKSHFGGEIGHNRSHRPSVTRMTTGGGSGGGPGVGDSNNGNGNGNGNGGGGGRGNGHKRLSTWADTVDTRLYTCLVAALATQPRFLAVTLAQDDPPSLLLDKTLLPVFAESLIGDTEADLVPIFLDLATFPFEATGIVSGVAGRLVQEMQSDAPELSYLSTARAGAVILSRDQSVKAVEILQPLLSSQQEVPNP